jgi:hypothetical protein
MFAMSTKIRDDVQDGAATCSGCRFVTVMELFSEVYNRDETLWQGVHCKRSRDHCRDAADAFAACRVHSAEEVNVSLSVLLFAY